MKHMQFTEIEVLKPARVWVKKLVKSHQLNLFLASSGHLEPLCARICCTVAEQERVRRSIALHE